MSFEEAKQYLRREDEDGSSLYEHLSRVLTKIIVEKPANANGMFETISRELRSGPHLLQGIQLPVEGDIQGKPEKSLAQLEWCETISKLYEEQQGEGSYPELLGEAEVFERAGVGLGKSEDTYRLYLALKSKAMADGLNLRFWGKIVAHSGDYFVAQSEENPEPPSEEDIDKIEGVEGANKYAYWVCKFPGDEWVRLPNVTPEAIVVARSIKRFFTGNLDSPVPSHPPFPGGTEAHLLRAQIARITSECFISPRGFYEKDEESAKNALRKVEEIEEYVSIEDLKDPGNWNHHELPINTNGRCNQVPPSGEDDEEAAAQDEEDAAPLLAPASREDDGEAWRIDVCPGDSIVVAKSLKWPGAATAAYDGNRKFLNVYFGFGYCSGRGTPYQPPPLAKIQQEWKPSSTEEGEEEAIQDLLEHEDVITAPPVEENEEDAEDE